MKRMTISPVRHLASLKSLPTIARLAPGLAAVALWTGSAQAGTIYTWDHNGATSGTKDWSTAANWSGDVVPTFVAGDTLDLSTIDLTAAAGVRLDASTGSITLGIIKIGSAANDELAWTISRTGSQVFNMDNGASAAQIIFPTKRNNNIQVPLVLYSNLELNDTSNQDRQQYLYSGATTLGITSASGLRSITNVSTGAAGSVGQPITIYGIIADGTGPGSQIKVVNSSLKWLSLTGANTFTGGVFVEAGGITATNAAMNANNLTVNGGEFQPITDTTVKIGGLTGTASAMLRTFLNQSRTLEISPASSSYTFAGLLANQGTGVLSVKKTGNGTQILSGVGTYTGNTTIDAGTLQVDGGNPFSRGATNAADASWINAEKKNFTVSNVQGFAVGNGVTQVGTNTGTFTITAVNYATSVVEIQNTGSTVNLLANSTVYAARASGTGTGTVTVNNPGTLGGTGTIGGLVTINPGGTLAPGNSIGTLTLTGNAVIDGTLKIELPLTGTPDFLAVTGNLDIGGATLDFDLLDTALNDSVYIFASYGSLSGSPFATVNDLPGGASIDYNYQNNKQIALLVPEPASLALLAMGGLLVLARRRTAM